MVCDAVKSCKWLHKRFGEITLTMVALIYQATRRHKLQSRVGLSSSLVPHPSVF
jgi:hypothetical protein